MSSPGANPVRPYAPAIMDPRMSERCGGCYSDAVVSRCSLCGFASCGQDECREKTNADAYHEAVCKASLFSNVGADIVALLSDDGDASPMIWAALVRYQAVFTLGRAMEKAQTPEALRAIVDTWRANKEIPAPAEAKKDGFHAHVAGLNTYGEDLPELVFAALCLRRNASIDSAVQLAFTLHYLYLMRNSLRTFEGKLQATPIRVAGDAYHVYFPMVNWGQQSGYQLIWQNEAKGSKIPCSPSTVLTQKMEAGEGLNVAILIDLVHTDQAEIAHTLGPKKGPRRAASTQILARLMHVPGEAAPKMQLFQGHGTLYTMGHWLGPTLLGKDELALLKRPGAAKGLEEAKKRFLHPSNEGTTAEAHTALRLACLDPAPTYQGMILGKQQILAVAALLDSLGDPRTSISARHEAYRHVTGVRWPEETPLKPFHILMTAASFTV